MLHLTKEQIDATLPKIKGSLTGYLWLQNEIVLRDVSKDRDFQRKFNAFYRVRRNTEWQKDFYKLMEASKRDETGFGKVLNDLYGKTGRMEASFVSKLIATINPELPIIDSIVFNNLGLTLPNATMKNRSQIIIGLYDSLTSELNGFLQTENGRYLVHQFEEMYPNKISEVKMLDFALWQIRD